MALQKNKENEISCCTQILMPRRISLSTFDPRHLLLSVGHLGNDGLLGASTTEVLVKGFLFQGLLGHDHILSTGVASSAVGVEDLFTSTGIGGPDGGSSNNGSRGTSNGSLGDLSVEFNKRVRYHINKLGYSTRGMVYFLGACAKTFGPTERVLDTSRKLVCERIPVSPIGITRNFS